jgi:hypothetical protein
MSTRQQHGNIDQDYSHLETENVRNRAVVSQVHALKITYLEEKVQLGVVFSEQCL